DRSGRGSFRPAPKWKIPGESTDRALIQVLQIAIAEATLHRPEPLNRAPEVRLQGPQRPWRARRLVATLGRQLQHQLTSYRKAPLSVTETRALVIGRPSAIRARNSPDISGSSVRVRM